MIGVDIIEIPRIARAAADGKLIARHFTPREIKYFKSKNMSPASIAGNWAAKEALAKALGTGVRGFSLIDVEILRHTLGQPFILCKGKRLRASVSISHSKDNAVAVVSLPWHGRLQAKMILKI